MESGWLPIGSVVVLKGGNKPLMIYGRKQFNSRTGHEFNTTLIYSKICLNYIIFGFHFLSLHSSPP
ncbi:hypothetical protein Calkro_2067 [Caldicellulosiruptor kronotskyensis 2002]|uniref:Uncharacterized protein n=1 Tax=Caldicellulosiruptor kronotskyensis (strain DSM 18902 / VKM B-2412 / 2002) TaxID=632348 RepID=E4SGN5_CALK2|nr:DUF4176 domain-containing protein [Caldicellulosiruptor kronotskyensis]ADQ46910.1 hypothetical protein Calkro_2067 [Caldicellulosiruptor kronotskyensis 2002]